MPGGVVEGCHLSHQGRKPGPVPWGLPPSGPALAPAGGRALSLEALPRRREGGLPGRGVSESAGRGAPKEGRRPRIHGVGRELPAGIPEAQPAAPGLMGGWVATKGPQPRRPRPICGGAVRPTGPATARPGHTGPATAFPGPNGARVPGGTSGTTPAKQGWSRGGQRAARRPLAVRTIRGEKPPLGSPTGGPTPRPHRAGVVFLSAAS